MWGVATPSLTDPAVVSTCGMRWGASSAPVSGTWTVSPPHDVVGVLAYRASMSAGELSNSPDGGIPALSVRQCTPPDSREQGWPPTRRHVSPAGPARHHAGAWEGYLAAHQAEPSAPMACASA